MRVALVFPPQGHFTQPYLSLPSLTAYLRANGYPDVWQLDENIAAYDHFLSRARLEEISALTDYRTARTEMARATGSLIEERGIDVGTEQRGGSR